MPTNESTRETLITRCAECPYFDHTGYTFQNVRCAAGDSIVGLPIPPLVAMNVCDTQDGAGKLPDDDVWKDCPLLGSTETTTWPDKV